MSEIVTAAERAAQAAPGEAEPRLTLSQVQQLLSAATEYAKAQRPVVLHQAAPIAAPQADAPIGASGGAPRHPGIDIDLTAAPPVAWAPVRHRAPQRPGWGVRVACASMLVSLAGGATAGATDGSTAAVAVCALGIAGVVGGIARAVTEQEA